MRKWSKYKVRGGAQNCSNGQFWLWLFYCYIFISGFKRVEPVGLEMILTGWSKYQVWGSINNGPISQFCGWLFYSYYSISVFKKVKAGGLEVVQFANLCEQEGGIIVKIWWVCSSRGMILGDDDLNIKLWGWGGVVSKLVQLVQLAVIFLEFG